MAKKITAFDKPTCRLIGDAFKKVTEAFAAQYGLTVKTQGGRFDQNSFTPKISFCVPAIDEESGREVHKKDMLTFKKECSFYGISPEAFGKDLMLGGKPYTMVGWNTRAPKSPITIVGENGKRFKCGTRDAALQFPLEKGKAKKTVEKNAEKCCYCGREEELSVIKMNMGACRRSTCKLKAMREEDPKFKTAYILEREKLNANFKKEKKTKKVDAVSPGKAIKSKTPKFDKFVKKFKDAGIGVLINQDDQKPRSLYTLIKTAVILSGEYKGTVLCTTSIMKGSAEELFLPNRKMAKRLL